jgi:hypothetical protein
MGKGDPDLVETDGVQDLEGLSHVDEVSGIVEVEEAASEFGRLEKKRSVLCGPNRNESLTFNRRRCQYGSHS